MQKQDTQKQDTHNLVQSEQVADYLGLVQQSSVLGGDLWAQVGT